MAGIFSYGVYIPSFRIKRADIAQFWEKAPISGERVAVGFDEDMITLAVEDGNDCLRGINRGEVDGLYFASTSPPYREKQCAAIVAPALDLRHNLYVADFANSLRAGTQALLAALNALKAGSLRNVLVIASESRSRSPQFGT